MKRYCRMVGTSIFIIDLPRIAAVTISQARMPLPYLCLLKYGKYDDTSSLRLFFACKPHWLAAWTAYKVEQRAHVTETVGGFFETAQHGGELSLRDM